MMILLHHLSDSILAAKKSATGVDFHGFVVNGGWRKVDWLTDGSF